MFYSLLFKQEAVAATKMTELSRPINFWPVRLAVVLSELILYSGSASGRDNSSAAAEADTSSV